MSVKDSIGGMQKPGENFGSDGCAFESCRGRSSIKVPFQESLRKNRPVRGLHVPYVVFENEDDTTTHQPEQLAARLEPVLDHLNSLRNEALQIYGD
ncbi:MAG: hypothetical protein AB1894_11335 [Chloroflexota bacterium]